ncbi:uncharacterized protein [Heterodontus francisci]|uniref:uncharacterized protein n=1 Tax=Heterodontus francisci TaxID=7792 RepID=UPI00355BA442
MGDDESRVFFGRDFDNWMQAQRLQAQLESSTMPKFSMCLNLGDIPPENVKMSITDGVVTVSGYQKEVAEDEDGMIRETFHGFSNEFGLPESVDTNTIIVNSNQDQSITIEADYYIPRGAPQGEEVGGLVCKRPSSVPPTVSQRENGLTRRDSSIPTNFFPPFSSVPLPTSTPRASITYDSAAFSPLPMKAMQNSPETPANITTRMSNQFDVSSPYSPNQTKNLQSSMSYPEDNSFGLSPQNGSNEMKVLQNTMGPLSENNTVNLSQFSSPSSLNQTRQSNLSPSADNGNDMQCKFNYSGLTNQALQTTMSPPSDNNAMFSQFCPAVQLNPCQMKALQQSEGTSADNSCGMPQKCTSLLNPCQKKAQQNSQRCAVENNYSNGTGSSPIQYETTCPLRRNYRGKLSNVEIPSCNMSNRSCQANRSLLKPGTRCEALSTCSPKYDYKLPGTRCPHSAQYQGETRMENKPLGFRNGNIMKNASSPGLTNKPW